MGELAKTRSTSRTVALIVGVVGAVALVSCGAAALIIRFATPNVWALMTMSGVPTNELGARLIVGGGEPHPIYMVMNDSTDDWRDVEIIVNESYRSTLAQLNANGGGVTLSPAFLFDANGERAPRELKVTDIEVRVGKPDRVAVLLKAGRRVP